MTAWLYEFYRPPTLRVNSVKVILSRYSIGINDNVIGIMDRPEKVAQQSINEYINSVYSSQGKENKWDLVDKSLRIQQFQNSIWKKYRKSFFKKWGD